MRVVHLVEQLLAHGVEVDQTACARGFGDEGSAVGPDLGNRVADVRQVREGKNLPILCTVCRALKRG